MGGGTSSASLDDSQEGEGGFHEGYWRYVLTALGMAWRGME